MEGQWETVRAKYSESKVIEGTPGISVFQGPNLLACPRCGSVVARETKDKHIEWHKRLNDILKVSANGFVMELLDDAEIV